MPELEKIIVFPPAWCARICRNSGNQVCVEECALKRDCSWFELKEGLKLDNMPRFPIEDVIQDMTAKERLVAFAVYLSAVVEVLKGVENERPTIDRPRSRPVLTDLQITGSSADSAPEDSLRPADGKADRDPGERTDEVD